MKIDCTIDGKTLSLNINSNKPLSLILKENLGNETVNTAGSFNPESLVFIDGQPVISSLVPAFECEGKEIVTFESFRDTPQMKEIEHAYTLVGVHPCLDCNPSRSMMIEALANDGVDDPAVLKKELAMIGCSCIDLNDQVEVVRKLIETRRNKQRVRRS